MSQSNSNIQELISGIDFSETIQYASENNQVQDKRKPSSAKASKRKSTREPSMIGEDTGWETVEE